MVDVNIVGRGTGFTMNAAEATTVPVVLPSDLALGDHILLVASVDFNADPYPRNPACPVVASWTELGYAMDGSGVMQIRAWLGRVTTAPTDAASRTASVVQADLSGMHVAARGYSAGGEQIVLDGTTAVILDRATPYTHTTVTPGGTKDLLVVAHSAVQFVGTIAYGAAPAGMTASTLHYNQYSGLQVCTQTLTSAAATGTRSQTSNIATLDGGTGLRFLLRAQSATGASIVVNNARATTRATSPLLTQASTLVVRPARADSRATSPMLAQQHDLVVRPARAATTASVPTLAQNHPLVVSAARAGTTASTPHLAQASTLLVNSARAGSRATAPLLAQVHELTVRSARAASRASSPLLVGFGELIVRAARAEPRATAPLLEQQTPLTARDARAATRATSPVLAQLHELAVRDARSASRATRPLLDAVPTLIVRSARAATRAGGPLLAQTSDLIVRAARAAAYATRPLLLGPVGGWVRSPTYVDALDRRGAVLVLEPRGSVEAVPHAGAVAALQRRGDVLLDVPGPVLVDAPPHGGGVVTDRRGLVVVDEAFGTVLDQT